MTLRSLRSLAQVIFDMSYITIQLFYVSGFKVGMTITNFIAIAIPFWLAIEMLHDSYLRTSRKKIGQFLHKRAAEVRAKVAKSAGTYVPTRYP